MRIELILLAVKATAFIQLFWMVLPLPTDRQTAAAIINEGKIRDGSVGRNTGTVFLAELLDDMGEDGGAVGFDAIHVDVQICLVRVLLSVFQRSSERFFIRISIYGQALLNRGFVDTKNS